MNDFLPQDDEARTWTIIASVFFICLTLFLTNLTYWVNRELTPEECELQKAKLIHDEEIFRLRMSN